MKDPKTQEPKSKVPEQPQKGGQNDGQKKDGQKKEGGFVEGAKKTISGILKKLKELWGKLWEKLLEDLEWIYIISGIVLTFSAVLVAFAASGSFCIGFIPFGLLFPPFFS